jgi:hypothetical protein
MVETLPLEVKAILCGFMLSSVVTQVLWDNGQKIYNFFFKHLIFRSQ